MPDLTQGTQLASSSLQFGVADYEAGKFYVIPGGTVAVRTAGEHASYLGTITIASAGSAGTLASVISGLVRRVTQTTPNFTGTGTTTTILKDATGGTVIGLAAQNESVTTSYGTVEPINSSMSWITTADGTQASAMNVVIRVHYDL